MGAAPRLRAPLGQICPGNGAATSSRSSWLLLPATGWPWWQEGAAAAPLLPRGRPQTLTESHERRSSRALPRPGIICSFIPFRGSQRTDVPQIPGDEFLPSRCSALIACPAVLGTLGGGLWAPSPPGTAGAGHGRVLCSLLRLRNHEEGSLRPQPSLLLLDLFLQGKY